jgi:hypothetical protein
VVENYQDQIVLRSRSESETRDQRGGVVVREYTHGSRDRRMVEEDGVAVDLTSKNPNTVSAKNKR